MQGAGTLNQAQTTPRFSTPQFGQGLKRNGMVELSTVAAQNTTPQQVEESDEYDSESEDDDGTSCGKRPVCTSATSEPSFSEPTTNLPGNPSTPETKPKAVGLDFSSHHSWLELSSSVEESIDG